MIWPFDLKSCPVLGPGSLVFGYNEPDRPDQANLTPLAAALGWHRLTIDCYPEREFIAPSTCATDTYSALAWLTDWVAEYTRLYGTAPRMAYLSVHCFSWRNALTCQAHITEAKAWAQAHGLRGIIVSEWAMFLELPSALREAALLRQWLEADPYVLGHAWTATWIEGGEKWWFGRAYNPSLFDYTTGALTPFGNWYAH